MQAVLNDLFKVRPLQKHHQYINCGGSVAWTKILGKGTSVDLLETGCAQNLRRLHIDQDCIQREGVKTIILSDSASSPPP